ncbi:MAG: BON domain-containing protein [Acidobacteriota bacterium]
MHRCRHLVLLALPAVLLASACAGRSGGVGEPLSEQERITAEVWRIIADQDGLVVGDLEVQTDGGVVVISGVQPELGPVSDLLRRVARVRGVTEVVNRIRIARGRMLWHIAARFSRVGG